MSKFHEARFKPRGELEAPPTLRRFGSVWISGVLGLAGHPVPLGYFKQFKYPIQRKKAAE